MKSIFVAIGSAELSKEVQGELETQDPALEEMEAAIATARLDNQKENKEKDDAP